MKKARIDANTRYVKKSYDTITIRFRKEKHIKDKILHYSQKYKKSVNSFLCDIIMKYIDENEA